MLEVKAHGSVRELVFSTALSRGLGYKVSAFVHRGTLIDTGFPRVSGALVRYLERHPVERAVVTHWHEDHSGNAAGLAAAGIPVVMSPATLPELPRTARLAPYRRLVWGTPAPLPPGFAPAGAAPPFELVDTPGHAVDHRVVWDPAARILFLGDLFLGIRASVMHHDEDPRAIVASLRRVIALAPLTAFCAHRGRLAEPVRLLAAKADWMERAIEAVDRAAAAGRADDAITRAVLGRDGWLPWLTSGELRKRHFVEAVRRTGTPRAER
jgi:glyoxylase-like metal-dependent hydrolase (beta-lactamase superfamily II)